jgi:hypothetical protein
MTTPFTSMRLTVSCMLAAAMLAACGGSQTPGSPVGTTPQAAGAPNSQHSTMLPADDGGGCGGDAQGRFSPNDDGHGCCGRGDAQGPFGPNDDGHGCCDRGDRGGDTQSRFRPNDDEGGHHCRSITVTPHLIFFTSSNPGPVTVKVHTRKQGTVSELDDCGGASGIATVTQGSGDQWTVTAGAQEGQCKALFILKNSSGKKIGQAVLHITNFL